ncbi:hypothetical protein [Ornithinicoccus hortensis]|uniref:Uncharacterized protein n=1 Tax=Ornithinicoccus hortensis TaxID=82346 RepID=A0A542YR85_9MICO|nr:hypothetical protein [Ornithinicoccus hortensis]TQL50568.1 hypothetical protein FB467_1680 [Ornithinicoccus hortensis]
MIAAAVESEWTRDYAAFMRCDAGDEWLPRAAEQVGKWLREKGFGDVDLNTDQDLVAKGARLAIRAIRDDAAQDFRIRMVEENDGGTWATDLVAHDAPGESDWVHVTVANKEGNYASVPRVAKYLMGALPLGDGKLELREEPVVHHTADLDLLVELLADRERHGLVLVAGTTAADGIPFDKFREAVGDWTRDVAGLAQVVVLDPIATQEFANRVGERFKAPAWTIRTYQPGVDFDDPASSRHHRMMGTARLANQKPGRTRHLLGEIARNHAAKRGLPVEVQRVRRRFERHENRRLVQTLGQPELELGLETKEAPQLPLKVEKRSAAKAGRERLGRAKEQLAEIALVKRMLKLEEITEASLRGIADRIARVGSHQQAMQQFQDRVDQLQVRVERLEDEGVDLREALDTAQLEAEDAKLDLDKRDGRIRWLESRLRDAGDYEAGYAEVPDEYRVERPDSFEDLIKQIEDLDGVEFTGAMDDVDKLNAIDTNEAALRTAWEAVLTLADYVKARAAGDCDNGLDHYIKHTPTGYRTISPGKWAHTETAQTMKGWGGERIFPVPASVDVAERAEMKAHFRLAQIGMESPRMYILDCHPKQPMVYVGYIGTHLTNTKTN